MKYKVITFLFLVTFFVVNAQEKKPVITFDKEIIDYGKITSKDNARRVFKFKNTGNAPLIIHKVKGSCGCVVLDYPKKPIMPNESAEIEIIYNVLKKGKISRTVTVTSNATEPVKVLKIKGRVLKDKKH
jgi:hypothetical protein